MATAWQEERQNMSKKERLEDLLLAGDLQTVELVIEMLGFHRGRWGTDPDYMTKALEDEYESLEGRYEKLVQPELYCSECGRKYEPKKRDGKT